MKLVVNRLKVVVVGVVFVVGVFLIYVEMIVGKVVFV